MIRKGFVYKLKPTSKQRQLFRQYAGAVRWVYNQMLEERQAYYEYTGEALSYNEQFKRLTTLKQTEDTEWLGDIHSQVVQQPIKNLRQAFSNFFEKRSGYPRFKSKKSTKHW